MQHFSSAECCFIIHVITWQAFLVLLYHHSFHNGSDDDDDSGDGGCGGSEMQPRSETHR